MQKLLYQPTSQMIRQLNKGSMQTKSTRLVNFIDWPEDLEGLSFRQSTREITHEDCNREIQARCEKLKISYETAMPTKVEIKLYNLTWHFKNNHDFVDLVEIFKNVSSTAIFDTDLCINLVDHFWEQYYIKLYRYQFLPFLFYSVLIIISMIMSMQPREHLDDKSDRQMQIIFGTLTVPFWFNLAYYECVQLKAEGWSHFSDFWSIIDFIHLTMNPFIVLISLPREPPVDMSILRIMAAFASCATMIKVYDWMRLFDSTAFFILLIKETLKDVAPFMQLVFISLMTFGIPMIMIDTLDEGNVIIDELTDKLFFNIVMNQYLLSLGEFNIDPFTEGKGTALCFLFFILATFITQVTMLNMLISIMGDTFSRVTENRELHARRTKLDLLADFAGILCSDVQDEDVFMFVVTPQKDALGESADGSSFEGVNCHTDRSLATLDSSISRHFSQLRSEIHGSAKREKQLRKQVVQMQLVVDQNR